MKLDPAKEFESWC